MEEMGREASVEGVGPFSFVYSVMETGFGSIFYEASRGKQNKNYL